MTSRSEPLSAEQRVSVVVITHQPLRREDVQLNGPARKYVS
ncbi:hypothetical protein [Mycolicibacterium chubuense]|nr:hypothetical protein [Mycolicibacterium chubuense]